MLRELNASPSKSLSMTSNSGHQIGLSRLPHTVAAYGVTKSWVTSPYDWNSQAHRLQVAT